ncbi:MAG: hypothetical protein K0S33_3744 [Bacteroidetes bacterium]|jgi:hypothetical protein|nr:hypothetical protein [Bacteroidota bacterium]
MATQIIDSGVSIKIVTNNKPKFVLKANILTVEVLLGTMIKIDIGKGALYNIYVDQVAVDVPSSSNVNDLRDQIHAMLQPAAGNGGTGVGFATEAKQIEQMNELTSVKNAIINTQTNQLNQITILNSLKNSIDIQGGDLIHLQSVSAYLANINGTTGQIADMMFYAPTFVDETEGNVIYNGYAVPGTATEAIAWAIQRVTNENGLITYHWANGNRFFDKRWDSRRIYSYF